MEVEVELSPGSRVTCFAANGGAGIRQLLLTAQGNRGDGQFCFKCPANQSCQVLHAQMNGAKTPALIVCPHFGYRPIGDVAGEASVERCSLPGKPCPHFDDCLSLKQSPSASQS